MVRILALAATAVLLAVVPASSQNKIQIGGPTSTVFLQAADGGLDLVAIGGASVMSPVTNKNVAAFVKNGIAINSPKDFVGKKVGAPGLTVALIPSLVCEILAGLDGLGHSVLLSARAFRSADLFAGVILLGVIGYSTSLMMSLVEARLLAHRRSIQ